MTLTQFLAKCFILLTMVYLGQTIFCLVSLEGETFEKFFDDQAYAKEIQGLIESICIVNIVHSLTLFSLGSFVILFTRRFKILNQSHYVKLGVLAAIITVVYFIPLIFISFKAWSDSTVENE